MSNQSEFSNLIGFEEYSVESSRNGLGSPKSLKLLNQNILTLTPNIYSASDAANIHYPNVPISEKFSYANGLLSEARAFLGVWPRTKGSFNYCIKSWANSGVDSELMKLATPEWVALMNILDVKDNYASSLDPSLIQTQLEIYQMWWGLVAAPNPKLYSDMGVAVTDAIVDPILDNHSGYGRPSANQYYPSLTQAFLSGSKNLLRVKSVTSPQLGVITDVLGITQKTVTTATQAPAYVTVKWDAGSEETVRYFNVRQLDPVLGQEMVCKAQLITTVNYSNKGDLINDFTRKLAYVLVIAVLDSTSIKNQYTETPEKLVKLWSELAGSVLPEQLKSVTYSNMTSLSLNGTTLTGWQTPNGQELMSQIYLIVLLNGLNGIGGKILKFMDRITTLPLGTVTNSGLVLCPECQFCEPINKANFVDFGIQTGQDFSCVNWAGGKFKAVGVVKCNSCNELYYRKFNPITRPFNNQLSIISVTTKSTPNLFIDDVRGVSGTASESKVIGYCFINTPRQGSEDGDGVPSLRLFGQLGNQVRADDIPLEVGIQSRDLRKKQFCSGRNLVSWTSNLTSHQYYDQYIGGSVAELDNVKGTGDFAGTNYNLAEYSTHNRTGLEQCLWCKTVGVKLNKEISETWVLGSKNNVYYSGDRNFLPLRSANNNQTFDTEGEDYIGNKLGGGVKFYKIRMVKGGDVRILEIAPNELGIKIPKLENEPAITLSKPTTVCPNEDEYFLEPYKSYFTNYLEAEQKHFNQESRFLVTEQLAYSALLNTATDKWEVKSPPREYLKNNFRRSYGSREELFSSSGVPAKEWSEGNPESITPQGSKTRFPEPAYTKDSAATVITPYVSNRRVINLKNYHNLIKVGEDIQTIEDELSGESLKIITPYLFCPECNGAFHGAPSDTEALTWTLEDAVGSELLNNGWTEKPITQELVFSESAKEDTRRDDSKGVYSSKSDWHWTLPLYSQGKKFNTFIQGQIATDPAKIKYLKFTPEMIKWIKAGEQFEVVTDE